MLGIQHIERELHSHTGDATVDIYGERTRTEKRVNSRQRTLSPKHSLRRAYTTHSFHQSFDEPADASPGSYRSTQCVKQSGKEMHLETVLDMKASCDLALVTLDDVLAYDRIKRGDFEVSRRAVDLSAFLQTQILPLRRQVR